MRNNIKAGPLSQIFSLETNYKVSCLPIIFSSRQRIFFYFCIFLSSSKMLRYASFYVAFKTHTLLILRKFLERGNIFYVPLKMLENWKTTP